jgi:D-alanyl-D-alanine carboxypeptidase
VDAQGILHGALVLVATGDLAFGGRQNADGSLAYTGLDLPARGHVFAKTGTTVDDGVLVAQNLAGYIDAKNRRRLAFALFVNNAGPPESISDE